MSAELIRPSPAMEFSSLPVLRFGAKRTRDQHCSVTGNAQKRRCIGGAAQCVLQEEEEKFLARFPTLRQSGTYLISRLGSILYKAVQKAPKDPEVGCAHPLVYGGTCLACQEIIGDSDWSGVRLDYLEPGFRIGCKQAGELRRGITGDLLESRKLHLVLDLDNTLLHTIHPSRLVPEEKHLKDLAEPYTSSGTTGDLFVNEKDDIITKLRPFVRSFLKEASELFELSVYTMGSRPYAKQMVDLLDPGRCYFGNRVIAREDSTNPKKKSLEVVLAEPSCTLILDDSLVWPCHNQNQIVADRYDYFTTNKPTHGRNLSPKEPGEVEDRNYLANVLDVLKSLHERYFSLIDSGYDGAADVRTLLQERRHEVLKGCHILIVGTGPEVEKARELGAVLHSTSCSSVTHVVSEDPDDDDSWWALEQNKFVVRSDWIFDAYQLWRKPPEHEFFPEETGLNILV